jgi:DNA-binding MarR family transcriptional regulator
MKLFRIPVSFLLCTDNQKNINQLCREINVHRANIYKKTILNLVKEGIIELKTTDEDKREKLVVLTKKGDVLKSEFRQLKDLGVF